MLKGIVVVFVNFFPEFNQTLETTLNFMKNLNSEVYEKIRESGYEVMFVGTIKEGTRVEKIDFDAPFPRSILPKMDIFDYADVEKSVKTKLINKNLSMKIKDDDDNDDDDDDDDDDDNLNRISR